MVFWINLGKYTSEQNYWRWEDKLCYHQINLILNEYIYNSFLLSFLNEKISKLKMLVFYA